MSKSKQIVQYIKSPQNIIKVGSRAFIKPINHPSDLVSNTTFVLTSTVRQIFDGGFETRNTIYEELKS